MNTFSFDHLDEIEFENFCYELLMELGFRNINWRKGTGLNASPADSGRDIECSLEKTDIDDSKYIEKWFVECKHHKKGIPPQKIQGILTWAQAENPDVVLIVASHFFLINQKTILKSTKKKISQNLKSKPGKNQILKNYVLLKRGF